MVTVATSSANATASAVTVATVFTATTILSASESSATAATAAAQPAALTADAALTAVRAAARADQHLARSSAAKICRFATAGPAAAGATARDADDGARQNVPVLGRMLPADFIDEAVPRHALQRKKTGSSRSRYTLTSTSIVPAASVSAGASTERAASTETAVEMEGCSVHCKWQLCVQDGDKTGALAPRHAAILKTCANDDVLNCDDEEYPHANMQCAAMPPPPPWVMPVSNTAPMPPFPRELLWLAVAAVVALIVIKGRTLYKLLPQDEQQPATPPPPPAPPTPNTQDEESAVTAKLRAEKEMAEAQAEKARAETQRAYAEADRATAEADKARAEAARAERASFAALDRIEGMSEEIKGLRDEVTRNLKDIAIAPPTPPKLLIDAFEPQLPNYEQRLPASMARRLLMRPWPRRRRRRRRQRRRPLYSHRSTPRRPGPPSRTSKRRLQIIRCLSGRLRWH